MENGRLKADKRLSITREAELLHSFVRINVKDEMIGESKESDDAQGETVGEGEKRIRQAPMSAETSTRLSKEITEEGNRRKGKKDFKRNTVRAQSS